MELKQELLIDSPNNSNLKCYGSGAWDEMPIEEQETMRLITKAAKLGFNIYPMLDIKNKVFYPKGYVEPKGKDKYIYFLTDPRTDAFAKNGYTLPHEPFYVGKGTGKRYRSRKNPEVNARLDELTSLGLEPRFVLIPYENDKDSYIAEESFIELIGKKISGDGPLLNKAKGGDQHPKFNTTGMPSWNKGLTKETCPLLRQIAAKISIKMKGRVRPTTPAIAKKLSNSVTESWGVLWRITLPDGKVEETTNLTKWIREYGLGHAYEFIRARANSHIRPFGLKVEQLKKDRKSLKGWGKECNS